MKRKLIISTNHNNDKKEWSEIYTLNNKLRFRYTNSYFKIDKQTIQFMCYYYYKSEEQEDRFIDKTISYLESELLKYGYKKNFNWTAEIQDIQE